MLKERREQRKIRQFELAQKILKHESYISKIELHPSECNPDVRTIMRIAAALGLKRGKVFEYFAENQIID
jgi:transcriptional regulator with XRE-family HTH domain